MKALIHPHLLVGIVLVLVHAPNETYGLPRPRVLNSIDRSAPPPMTPITSDYGIHALNRSCFPRDFIFGSASSAYQIEGAWNVDGKGQSNWDNFTHAHPEKIKNGSNGDVACDSYNRYREDVLLLSNMNVDAYRFSIAWTRLIPSGKLSGGINMKGIQYYNNLIDELLANGIKPVVTIYHWDTPQALEDEYGGFLNTNIFKDFSDYAELCFKTFGDRVKHWITINEISSYTILGYDAGDFPPVRCSPILQKNCTGGNSGTEPYIVAHNSILAHAHAVKIYRDKYQKHQKGIIGMSIPGLWAVPLTNSSVDRNASLRFLEFNFGWLMNPLAFGDYPAVMREFVGERLLNFTIEDSKLVKGSYDFIGFNYYSAVYIGNLSLPTLPPEYNQYSLDMRCNMSYTDVNGNLIGEQLGSDWLHVYPLGLFEYLRYLKHKYNDPIIYITENGADEKNDPNSSLEASLQDYFRIKYYFKHLAYLKSAIDHGIRVKGYFGWALLDNFEWQQGYNVRFGINYVNYTSLERFPKLSAHWFKRFLQK